MAQICSAHEALKHTFESLLNFINGEMEPGIPTGFSRLDSLTGGLQPGKVIVLAARPAMCKSALALNMARNILRSETPHRVLYCSPTMDEIQMMSRLLCLEANISLGSVLDDPTPSDTEKLTKAAEQVKDYPLWIDPSSGLTSWDLCDKIRSFARENPLELIVIDSLDELRSENEADRMSPLNKLAKELNLPILLLAAIRPRKRALSLGDLPEGIAEFADVVLFLDRKIEKKDTSESGVNVTLTVAKNRFGFTGLVPLKFFPATMKFVSCEADDE